MRGIEAQFLALQKGFNELIPQHLLKPFDQKELEVRASRAARCGEGGSCRVRQPFPHRPGAPGPQGSRGRARGRQGPRSCWAAGLLDSSWDTVLHGLRLSLLR